MYKKFKILYLLLLIIPTAVFAQSKEVIYKDGPYIFCTRGGSVRIVSSDGFSSHKSKAVHKKLLDTVYANIAALGTINVADDKGIWNFKISNSALINGSAVGNVKANGGIKKSLMQGEKIFVISDAHGNFKNFIAILKKGGVINEKLEWSYGKNRLMILGDTFDRGNDVVTIFWLIYNLEQQASAIGGEVSYLLGNHDNMVLKGDLRYVKSKYEKLQDTLKIPYNQFFSSTSFLGKWLRGKNSIEIIGNTLFVHGGISPAFAKSGISIGEANMLIKKHLDSPKSVYENVEGSSTLGKVNFLFGINGPLWYRGLVSGDKKYNPISEAELDNILKQYKISRIVVGHTTCSGVKTRYNGKVISVDSENEKQNIDHLAEGIEISDNKVKIIKN
ncbi:MAG: metallophosphoesterase [Bacteroidales bacterium]